MSNSKCLRQEEHDFFKILSEVIFSNPFSFEQSQLEAMLGNKITQKNNEHHYSALVPMLEQKLSDLSSRGIKQIKDVDEAGRELLETAFLFQIYHQFVDEFDALIQAQIAQGEEPVAVTFAQSVLTQLKSRGFLQADALRYLSLFYQLRRAFFFIARSLVGDSASMTKLRHALWNNVFTSDVMLYANHLWDRMEDFSTLILGGTGTGKGSAAAAIGRSGLIPYDVKLQRFEYSFTQTFIAINLSEFPETLIESELFGHRKGAFTGAIDHHVGIFERCNYHGSLFLDEIGDVSVPIQIKLLTVLQSRQFTPVGSHSAKRFSGRVIAATNQPLMQYCQQGQFRQDFYYRLSSDVIEVPSLQQRLRESKNELAQLVTLLVGRMMGEPVERLIAQVLDTLNNSLPADYAWPGNVRELEQAIRRIILNNEYKGSIPAADSRVNWLNQAGAGQLTAQELLIAYCKMLYQKYGTYEEVAKRAVLDRRTAKKYVETNNPNLG